MTSNSNNKVVQMSAQSSLQMPAIMPSNQGMVSTSRRRQLSVPKATQLTTVGIAAEYCKMVFGTSCKLFKQAMVLLLQPAVTDMQIELSVDTY